MCWPNELLSSKFERMIGANGSNRLHKVSVLEGVAAWSKGSNVLWLLGDQGVGLGAQKLQAGRRRIRIEDAASRGRGRSVALVSERICVSRWYNAFIRELCTGFRDTKMGLSVQRRDGSFPRALGQTLQGYTADRATFVARSVRQCVGSRAESQRHPACAARAEGKLRVLPLVAENSWAD